MSKQIEKYFKYSIKDVKSIKSNDGDRANFLRQIQQNMQKMRECLNYFKSEIYKIPKDKEAKYRAKF